MTTADALGAQYQALRTLALLPYQALMVVTFVIFPLVSRSTFAEDREATRVYVTQTLRYALILVAAMGIVLAARPAALLALIYKPAYVAGAPAMPILVLGECCLALLGVVCAILNAAGRTNASLSFVVLTVTVGVGRVGAAGPARGRRRADAAGGGRRHGAGHDGRLRDGGDLRCGRGSGGCRPSPPSPGWRSASSPAWQWAASSPATARYSDSPRRRSRPWSTSLSWSPPASSAPPIAPSSAGCSVD